MIFFYIYEEIWILSLKKEISI